jgi:hypothetical protein
MFVAYRDRRRMVLAAGALLVLSLPLGGCATSTSTGSSLMDARAEAPMPPKTSTYLPVEDLPPPRAQPAMTDAERSKLQNELIAARDRQEAAAKSQGKAQGGPITDPAKP